MMNDSLFLGEFVPTCDAEVDIGQVVFDATTKTDYTITALTGRTIVANCAIPGGKGTEEGKPSLGRYSLGTLTSAMDFDG